MLTALVRIARGVVRESWLVCPDCGGEIFLRAGVYRCRGVPYDECDFVSLTLEPCARIPKGGRHG